jgi:uncharacterized protein (DUF924 family)
MRGGADDEIITRFSDLTETAADGALDHWASDAEGRLALIIVLDQFSRSIWRGSARAFAQDLAALSLVTKGLANGHYAALGTPWFRIAYSLALGHREGPEHLERLALLIRLREEIAADDPAHLRPIYRSLVDQADVVQNVIAAFGRHPHRNGVLGRQSSPAEIAYIAEGRFPHLMVFQT